VKKNVAPSICPVVAGKEKSLRNSHLAENFSFKFNRAFTLVEIIIASGLFLAFVSAVFFVYNSGTKSINTGSWRLMEQKTAQRILSEWVKDLERATPSIARVASSGRIIHLATSPIEVNSALYSTNGTVRFTMNNSDWKCLMVFSITSPYREANATLSIDPQIGSWTGVSVWGRNHQLRYIRNDNPTTWLATPINWGLLIAYPTPPAAEYQGSHDRIQDKIECSSLEELAVVGTGTSVNFLEIRAKFKKYDGGQPARPETVFEEVVGVKLATGTEVKTFTH